MSKKQQLPPVPASKITTESLPPVGYKPPADFNPNPETTPVKQTETPVKQADSAIRSEVKTPAPVAPNQSAAGGATSKTEL